jgi:hypothetical protein
MSQWRKLGRAGIVPRAWDRMASACMSASMLGLSSLVSGRSIWSACPSTQWKLSAIPLHHRTMRSWIVAMRSQSHLVLWNILLDVGPLAEVTADLLWHINIIDRMFMVPERNSVPRTARPATIPPSSDRYDFIRDWIPSSGPPPRRRIVSSFVARTQPWYPTPNSTDPLVAMIRSTGPSKSNGVGVGSAGMSPVSRWMCRGKAKNESPMPMCNYGYEWGPYLTRKLYWLLLQLRDSEFSA